MRHLKTFWLEESGQDTVEYILLLLFAVFTSVALSTDALHKIRSLLAPADSYAAGIAEARILVGIAGACFLGIIILRRRHRLP